MSVRPDHIRTSPAPSDPAPAPDNAIRGTRLRRIWVSPVMGGALGLVVLVVVFAVLSPTRFATSGNAYNVLADASVLVIMAMPTTLILITGQLDLASGSIIAFSQVVSVEAMLAVGGGGSGTILLGLLAAVGAGLLWGLLNGFLVARAGLPSFIVTLATLGAALGAAYLLCDGQDIAQVPPALIYGLGVGTVLGLPIIAVIAAVVVAVTVWVLRATRFGRHTYAVGSDVVAAERAGIPVRRHTATIFAVAGACYGLAAFLYVARFGTTTVGGHNQDALNAIAAVALGGTSLFGGTGSALGSVVGVFIPAVLQNGLVIVSVQPYWQLIAIAAALLVAVYADQTRRRTRRR
jgi:ribose transport system permease protein